MCCYDYLVEWWNSPNKQLFKLAKLVLTILRAILFLIFLLMTYLYQAISVSTNTNRNLVYLAELCLILEVIYNWRFLLTVLLLFLILILKILNCACSTVTGRFYLKLKKNLYKCIRALHWEQLDWPCFLRLKYYMYIFDIIHYLAYFISCLVIGSIQISNSYVNQPPIIAFYFNSFLFLIHIIIEIYRIVQAQRVQGTIRDIFASDFKFSSKSKKMISEDQLGSLSCTNLTKCSITDSQHRAFSHPKDIFKIRFTKVELNDRGTNIMVGFHQTTIEAARSILTTSFKPSKSGMIGPGIYFANNYDITEHKRNQSTEGGAIFCAIIDMGKVLEVASKNDNNIDVSKYYNSKYLHHAGGEKYDEFVIYSEKQILEYTIIVENKAIENYRNNSQDKCCYCI